MANQCKYLLKGDRYMPELYKATASQEVFDISSLSSCWCVCVCLIFTERRHSDLLAAGHSVAAN